MKREKGMIGVLCTLVLMILLLVPLQAAQASVKVDFNELKGNDVSSSFKDGLNNRRKQQRKMIHLDHQSYKRLKDCMRRLLK